MDAWLLLIFSIFLASVLTRFIRSNSSSQKKRRLPPGPPALPFLAKFLCMRKSIFDIEPVLRELRVRYGPLLTLHMPSFPAIFISDRFLAQQALVQQGAVFADRPPASEPERLITSNQCNISSAPYGPRWRTLRRNLAAEILHPSRVKLFAPARRWALDTLTNKLEAQAGAADGVVVAMESFLYAMFCLLVLMCFGEKLGEAAISDIKAVQQYILVSFIKLDVFVFFPRIAKLVFRNRWNEFAAARGKQEALFIPLIRARRERELKESSLLYSYVDSLLELPLPEEEGGRKLSEDEMVSLCSELLNGGTDTTATSLQWIMANLVKHQHIQEKLVQEIDDIVGKENKGEKIEEEDLQRMPYLKAIVLEGLRRHPPGHFLLPHTVTEDTSLNGYTIPRGAVVNIMLTEIGWDKKVWKEPMEFRPERFMEGGEGEGVEVTGGKEIRMMPFGAGRRACPGYGLAMLHLEYFVANLVRKFEWKAVEGEEVDLEEKLEFTVVMKKPLRARISPRISKSM